MQHIGVVARRLWMRFGIGPDRDVEMAVFLQGLDQLDRAFEPVRMRLKANFRILRIAAQGDDTAAAHFGVCLRNRHCFQLAGADTGQMTGHVQPGAVTDCVDRGDRALTG